MTTIYDMDEKKDLVRSIRLESALWEIIEREASRNHRTIAGQLRFFLERELTREGLIIAEERAHYQTRAAPKQRIKGGS